MATNDRKQDETARMLAALSDVASISMTQKRHFLTHLMKLAMVELIDPLEGAKSPSKEERRHFQS